MSYQRPHHWEWLPCSGAASGSRPGKLRASLGGRGGSGGTQSWEGESEKQTGRGRRLAQGEASALRRELPLARLI